jgi:hypothetical protein
MRQPQVLLQHHMSKVILAILPLLGLVVAPMHAAKLLESLVVFPSEVGPGLEQEHLLEQVGRQQLFLQQLGKASTGY